MSAVLQWSIFLYQLLRNLKVRTELYITSSHTPTEQLLQLKKKKTLQNPSIPEQAGGERGERRKHEDRPHMTSSCVHRVAEATLKSVPQVLTCVTKITADWG